MTLPARVLAGGRAFLLGAFALSATEGAGLRRQRGILFVHAMLTVAFTGIVIAVVEGAAPAVNVPAAFLTACLVVAAPVTIRAAFRTREQPNSRAHRRRARRVAARPGRRSLAPFM